MKIVAVPDSLRSERVKYPWHATDYHSEGTFYAWALQHCEEVNTRLLYLPIFWWCNSFHQGRTQKTRDFFPVAEAQKVLNNLSPNERYFSVSNCDDGPYEDVPPNVILFGAGGYGTDIPIPLLTDPLPRRNDTKTLLASFVGQVETGGRQQWPRDKAKHSSWVKDGFGAVARRRMVSVFDGVPNVLIKNQGGGDERSHREFCNTAAASWFSLCPRGYGKTSYRLYEVMQLDSIPVYIYDDPWIPYWDLVDWREFCVLCHVTELELLPSRLRSISIDSRMQMLRRLGEVLPEYFTKEATCRQIAKYVEALG